MASPQPSTHLEALTAELLGDIGGVHDHVKALREQIPELGRELSTTAKQAVESAVSAGSWPAVVRAVVVSALCSVMLVAVGAGGGYWYGRWVAGARLKADSTLAKWALTREGRAAYELDRANAAFGGVSLFAGCKNQGWQVVMVKGKAVCQTSANQHVVYGWYLPKK